MEFNSTLVAFFLTVIGGVVTFVVSQIAVKLFVKPIQAQAKTIGAIHYVLMFYRNKHTNFGKSEDPGALDLSNRLRDQASQLRADTNTIRWYRLWELLRLVPKRMQ